MPAMAVVHRTAGVAASAIGSHEDAAHSHHSLEPETHSREQVQRIAGQRAAHCPALPVIITPRKVGHDDDDAP